MDIDSNYVFRKNYKLIHGDLKKNPVNIRSQIRFNTTFKSHSYFGLLEKMFYVSYVFLTDNLIMSIYYILHSPL